MIILFNRRQNINLEFMKNKQAWRTFGLLLTLTVIVGCGKSADESSAPSTSSNANQKSSGYFQTQFQDESQFIVEAIVSDLAEQIFFAKHHQLPNPKHFSVHAVEKPDSPSGAPVYEVQISLSNHLSLSPELDVNGPIWSPEVYKGMAAALAKAVELSEPAVSEHADTDLLLALTDGSAVTIERENQKLSKELARNFSDPSLHEKAAVVLGAFTLREHSGDFFEIRSPLCRITAHLAFAQFLAGTKPSGVNGRIGEAMLYSLMNDQALALEKLKTIERGTPAVDCWIRTLNAYNSGDYRPIADIPNPSILERIAWFRAFSESVDVDVGWEKLTDSEKMIPDFPRIANGENYSVETGHQLLALSLPVEFKEVATVYELARGRQLSPKEMAAKLNEMPERCFVTDGNPRVIGWGQWAMFFQRHMCHAVQQNFYFMNEKWGVHDEAKEFSGKCDELLSELRLYPFVRRFNCTDVKSYHSAVDDGMRVTVATPHLTPAECWNYLCYRVPFAQIYQPNSNPHINEWHKHNPPPGTAYNPLPRFNHPSLVGRSDVVARVNRLHDLAPYDQNISYNLIQLQFNKKPTYDQAQQIYKPVLPYATYAMTAVADTVKNQPERYEALMSSAAETDPVRYFNLGNYFRQQGMDDKASEYFEKGSEHCQDSVLVSNYALWRVRYYLKKGETLKARHVADEGGEVYSAVGLQAKAEFFETTGDYMQAFEWYAKDEERYDDPGPLMGFCMRYKEKTGNGRFDAELRKRSGSLFPKGIEKATLKDFQSPPSDGVFIAKENNLIRQAGLKRGDVIVAVHGIRVHSFKQYGCAREFTSKPELDLIIWQGDGYHQIKASPPNHRFGVDFVDYPVK